MKYLLFLLLPVLLFGQVRTVTQTGIKKSMIRGDATTITWRVKTDMSSDSLLFIAVDEDSNAVLRMTTGGSLTTAYSNPYTTITATISAATTENFIAQKYLYDITNVTDSVTLIMGILDVIADVSNLNDTVVASVPYYMVNLSPPDYDTTWIWGNSADSSWNEINTTTLRTIVGATSTSFDTTYIYNVTDSLASDISEISQESDSSDTFLGDTGTYVQIDTSSTNKIVMSSDSVGIRGNLDVDGNSTFGVDGAWTIQDYDIYLQRPDTSTQTIISMKSSNPLDGGIEFGSQQSDLSYNGFTLHGGGFGYNIFRSVTTEPTIGFWVEPHYVFDGSNGAWDEWQIRYTDSTGTILERPIQGHVRRADNYVNISTATDIIKFQSSYNNGGYNYMNLNSYPGTYSLNFEDSTIISASSGRKFLTQGGIELVRGYSNGNVWIAPDGGQIITYANMTGSSDTGAVSFGNVAKRYNGLYIVTSSGNNAGFKFDGNNNTMYLLPANNPYPSTWGILDNYMNLSTLNYFAGGYVPTSPVTKYGVFGAKTTNSPPDAGIADMVQFYSTDLSAGNTIPSFYTEGTGVITGNNSIVNRYNGTVRYIPSSTTDHVWVTTDATQTITGQKTFSNSKTIFSGDSITVMNDLRYSTGYFTQTELSYLDGVTSAVQTQLNAKEGTLTNEAGLYSALDDVTLFLEGEDSTSIYVTHTMLSDSLSARTVTATTQGAVAMVHSGSWTETAPTAVLDTLFAYETDLGATFDSVTVDDRAYNSNWNGSNVVPTKNAVYDKIETLSASWDSTYIYQVTDSLASDIAGIGDSNFVLTSETTNWDKDVNSDFDTLAYHWGVMDTVTVGDLVAYKVESNITIVKVSAYGTADSVLFNIQERAAGTPTTAGDSLFASPMWANSTGKDSTSFTGSGGANFAKNTWIQPVVTTGLDATRFGITVWYIKQDY